MTAKQSNPNAGNYNNPSKKSKRKRIGKRIRIIEKLYRIIGQL
jgi:hypothetical protein